MTFLKHHWTTIAEGLAVVVILGILLGFHIADRTWPFGWVFDAGRWA